MLGRHPQPWEPVRTPGTVQNLEDEEVSSVHACHELQHLSNIIKALLECHESYAEVFLGSIKSLV